MDKKSTNPGARTKRSPDLGAARTLILTIGFALILVLWTLFSKQLSQAYTAEPSTAPTSDSLPPSASSSGLVLDLPPLPTLIPEATTSSVGQLGQPPPKSSNVVPAVPAQAPAKIFLGGAKPQPRSQAPAPVTRTRSSRP